LSGNKNISGLAKNTVKFIVSAHERKILIEQKNVRKKQNQAIRQFDANAKKLVVFLVPGVDRQTGVDKISGGIISIVSICEESAALKEIHGAEVIMCTLPNELLLFRHTQFANKTDVFRFNQLRSYFKQAEDVIIHLPEFTCDYFLEYLEREDKKWIDGLKKVHINILNQNIRLMPELNTIDKLKELAALVTATTAHQRYCNQQYRDKFGIPIHKFSVWISPEKYSFTPYSKKENLIVVSPDLHMQKEEVLKKLASVNGLAIQIIQNLTYEQYKQTISRAKWAITFGEGLDGYIIEPIFSGAIGFAVYNEEFFTPDFRSLQTIYPSYEQLLNNILSDIERLDNEGSFNAYQQSQFDICASHYSQQEYRRNIASFYKGSYTFP